MMTKRFLVSIAAGIALAAAPAVAVLASPATAVHGTGTVHSCAVPAHNDRARCFAVWSPQTAVNAALAAGRPAAPAGLGARQIEAAYRLPVGRNPHATVAVVEAYDTPGLPADLSTYRSHYGLGACTKGSGCLRVVNQNGQTSPLPPNGYGSGWDVEATLDVDMVSTACPKCKILVVEANSASLSDLATAERAAARLGAVAISNSYGARENGFTQAFTSAYNLKGHTIVASSGDLGYTAANWPANLATVCQRFLKIGSGPYFVTVTSPLFTR